MGVVEESAHSFVCRMCQGKGRVLEDSPDWGITHSVCLTCGGSGRMPDRHLLEEIAQNLRKLVATHLPRPAPPQRAAIPPEAPPQRPAAPAEDRPQFYFPARAPTADELVVLRGKITGEEIWTTGAKHLRLWRRLHQIGGCPAEAGEVGMREVEARLGLGKCLVRNKGVRYMPKD